MQAFPSLSCMTLNKPHSPLESVRFLVSLKIKQSYVCIYARVWQSYVYISMPACGKAMCVSMLACGELQEIGECWCNGLFSFIIFKILFIFILRTITLQYSVDFCYLST